MSTTAGRKLADGVANAGPEGASASRAQLLPVILAASLLVAALCWLAGLFQIQPDAMSDYGLISVMPWLIWISYLLIAAGLAASLGLGLQSTILPRLHLALLVLVLHATPAIAYGTLRYSWAWKHVGIVDYIQRHGSLDPEAAFLAAYHNWPGFFIAMAALADLLGLGAMEIAGWASYFPTLLNLLFLLALPPLFRSFTGDERVVWCATAIFIVGNWVGQDYFSPQGTAFLMYLVALGLCLGPLARTATPVAGGAGSVPQGAGGGSLTQWQRLLPFLTAFGLFAAIVVTHQLTPLLLLCALAGLVALKRLSWNYLLFAALLELLWLFFFADPYVSLSLREVVAEFGAVGSESFGKLVELDDVSSGHRWIAVASRGLSAVVAAAAVIGAARRFLTGHRDWSALVLAAAPAPLLLATPYGGEILFRLYFYSLPFLAFFAAAAFFPTPGHGRSAPAAAVLGFFLLALTLGFVLANNGKDRQYRFSAEEVAAAEWLYRQAPAASLLIEGSRNYPSQMVNYERFTYLPISEEGPASLARILEDPSRTFHRWLADAGNGFVIITRSQKANIDDLGIMPRNSLDRIELALTRSPLFHVAYANADARIFTLSSWAANVQYWVGPQ